MPPKKKRLLGDGVHDDQSPAFLQELTPSSSILFEVSARETQIFRALETGILGKRAWKLSK
jgi:hypothetical protein